MQFMAINPNSFALAYARRGWKLIPLHSVVEKECTCGSSECRSPGKHPRIAKWTEKASNQLNVVFDWWREWPDANIGIVTGRESGLVVLDVDPRHDGDQSLMRLQREHEPLPETLTSNTGGGGFHIFFRAPSKSIRNKVNVRAGLDVRGDGGYVVAPPGQHASGGSYEWNGNPNETPIAEIPNWLLKEMENSSKLVSLPLVSGCMPEGGRNDFLARKAGSFRRANLGTAEIEGALLAVNQTHCKPPLPASEVKQIVASISRYANSEEQKISWPEVPKPLPTEERKVPNLDEKMIPEILREWVMDVAERMHVAPELIAAPAIVSMASVVGRKIGIFPRKNDNWFVVPNLWGAVVARPGSLKSPAIAEAMRPLDMLARAASEKYQADKNGVEAREQALTMEFEAKREELKKSFKSDKGKSRPLEAELAEIQEELRNIKVVERRYKTNDATVEKLGHILRDNPNGILLFRDELAGWIRTLDKAGREGDREFYLESWNGYGSYSVDRIGNGTVHIPALCLSIFGGIQPSKIEAQIKGASGGKDDDGLLQRFQILVYPERKPEWQDVDRLPNEKAFDQIADYFSWLDKLDGKQIASEVCKKENIPGVRFSDDAQEVFRSWRKTLENRLESREIDNLPFEAHLAKYRSLVPSLALLFWLPEVAQGTFEGGVSKLATELAVQWASFLEAHARRVYDSDAEIGATGALTLHRKIISGDLVDGTPLRRIYRSHWSHLSDNDEVDAAVETLETLGWLRVLNETGRGGLSRIIKIHPKFLG